MRARNYFVWAVAVSSLALASALIVYAIRNDSRHTSFEPWLLSGVFAASTIIGFLALFFGRPRTAAFVALGIGIAGLALLFCLDHLNVLVQYDRWLQRGMP